MTTRSATRAITSIPSTPVDVRRGQDSDAPITTLALDPPVSAAMVTADDAYHAFGFDRLVSGFTGDTVTLKELDGDTTEDFGFDIDTGMFDMDAVDAWRAGADVDAISFYDQTENGADAVFGGTVAFVRSDVVERFGCDYEEENGDNIDITAITQATNAEITTDTAHGYSTGKGIYITGITGMIEMNALRSAITVTGTYTFTLDDVDSTAFTAYTSGGFVSEEKRGKLTRSATEGGVGADLGGVGWLKIDNTTVDVSGSGLEIAMLASMNTRKIWDLTKEVVVPPGNNDGEYTVTYGTGNDNYMRHRFYSTFGTFSWIKTLNAVLQDDIGGANRVFPQYGQFVERLLLNEDEYRYDIHGVKDSNEDLNADTLLDVQNGVIDDGKIVVGAFFLNTSGDVHTTSNIGNFLFGGIVVYKNDVANGWMVQSKLGAVGQQHRIKSKDDIIGMFGELHLMKDVDGAGVVAGVNGEVDLEWRKTGSPTTDFAYIDPLTGLQGINRPDQNDDNGFAASNNYFAGVFKGTIVAFAVNDIVVNNLGYIFGMNDPSNGWNTVSRGDGTTSLGRDHSSTEMWNGVTDARDTNGIVGNRHLVDGTAIGDSAGGNQGNQAHGKYNNKITHANFVYPSTIGAYSYDEAGWKNEEPIAVIPADKNIDKPTGFFIANNISGQGFHAHNDMPLLQVGTFEAPDGYDRDDILATREPYFLQADNKSYACVTGSTPGHVYADISHNPYGAVNESTDDAIICSNKWYSYYQGTTFLMGYIPNVVLTLAQVQELQINLYKLFE